MSNKLSSKSSASGDQILTFAKYNIECIESFALRPDIEEIANFPLPSYNFSVEKAILLRYEKYSKEDAERKMTATSAQAASRVQAELSQAAAIAAPVPDSSPDFNHMSHLIDSMATETGETKDVCHFYLESSDWDYSKAVDMLKAMTSSY